MMSLFTLIALAYAAPDQATPDAADATLVHNETRVADIPAPWRVSWFPQIRLQVAAEAKNDVLTVPSVGVGVQLFHTQRWGVEVNAGTTTTSHRLVYSRAIPRFFHASHFTADAMYTINPMLEVGVLAGATYQSYEQQNRAVIDRTAPLVVAWPSGPIRQVVPIAGIRAQVYVLRSRTWGLAINSGAHLDLVATELVDDANIERLSPLTILSGARLIMGHGKNKQR